MKSYTNLEQSKKLAEFLPLESADMYYFLDPTPAGNIYHIVTPQIDFGVKTREPEYNEGDVPCWSLAALLNVIPYAIHKSDNEFYRLGIDKGYDDYAVWYNNNGFTITDLDVVSDNFVDACVAMILKLRGLNLL